MNSQFTKEVSRILALSREEAARLANDTVGAETLLLGILRQGNTTITDALRQLHSDPMEIKLALDNRLRVDHVRTMPNTESIALNESANNILRLAVLEARRQHKTEVDVEHLMLAILHDFANNGAKMVLEENNVTYNKFLGLVDPDSAPKDGIGLPDDDEEDDELENAGDSSFSSSANKGASNSATTTKTDKANSATPVIDNFGVDLTDLASHGALDPVVGREKEILRVMEILGRRKKNNPVLIGEPGVGKSAIVEGLAQMIVNKQTSPLFYNKRLVNLDMTSIVAGTKYRGQFEERLKALLKELENNPDIIIFIDEIHTLVGAGSTPGTMDAANIMKPALARGVIQCIGATTLDEYRNSIEKDGALERRFQKVMVEPTTREQTLQILTNIRERYEQHHHVSYSDDALKACVTLTERYISDRQFPDKAIDAMDEAGSHIRISKCQVPQWITEKQDELKRVKSQKQSAVKDQNYEMAAAFRDIQTKVEAELKEMNEQWTKGDHTVKHPIDTADIENVVSMMTGIPVQKLGGKEEIRLKGMASELKGTVVAQDKAIDKVVKAIQRNRVGLKDPNHPIGVFMFLGPTGVGKTFLAKKLAEFMFGTKDALIRVDMSEYSEQHTVSRLVGAPPGYVGYGEGGQLTEKVRRHPYSVVLLDEIEKAHGNVFNMLLQVFDDGRLTDGNGRTVDFRNTVIIMTSNAGTRQLKDFARGVGFTAAGAGNGLASDDKDKEYARSIIQKALSKQFSPEFLNRLDEIITFDQLDIKAIRQIINGELDGLFARIESLGYKVEITDEAKDMVAKKGYDVQFGARPLKRSIQNHIEDGLSDMIINGDLKAGDTISIGKKEGKDELEFNIKE
ncbi:MAG: ATP-dependent Clp protease ATP-binding subunit [Prevotella sp.]